MTDDLKIPVVGINRLRMGTDGSGIRTLVGTAGCSLRCRYCLNPQSWNGEKTPVLYTPQELCDKVALDNFYFMMTGGGVTFGGGEPLLHMESIEKFRAVCPQYWSLWAETSLHVSRAAVLRAAEVFDHFVVDIKTTDPEVYRRYTGADLSPALSNLELLLGRVPADRILVRVPQIPGFAEEPLQKKSLACLASMGVRYTDPFRYTVNLGGKEGK